MSSNVVLTEADEGKRVINARGDEIGRVVEVAGGSAFVDPDPGIADSLLSKLGWADRDEDDYRLDPADVTRVTDEEIRLSV